MPPEWLKKLPPDDEADELAADGLPPKKRLRERLRRAIERHNSLRLGMFAILLLVVAGGLFVNWLLYRAGLHHMALRYALATVGSYLVFLGLVRWWIGRILGWLGEAEPPELHGGATLGAAFVAHTVLERQRTSRSKLAAHAGDAASSAADGGLAVGDILGIDGDLFILIVLIGVVLFVLTGGVVLLLWQAPAIITEAVLSIAMVPVVMRTRRASLDGWFMSVFKNTAWMFLLFLIAIVLFAVVAQQLRPEATRLAEVFAPR